MTSEIVSYKADNGQDIQITEQDVRDLLKSSGNKTDNVTSEEIKAYMRLCQAQRLNPFTRDAYIVKYGNSPASVIAGKDAFVKRATRNPRYQGHEAGITVVQTIQGQGNKLVRREGSMLLPGEQIIGGWAKVYLTGYACPIYDEVSYSEYAAPDQYGKNGWSRMPATMIRKVALCHALREAFPEDLGGLYSAEEMEQAQREEAPRQEAPREVEAYVEGVPMQPNRRKELWAEVAQLKQTAISLGTQESGITSWAASQILNQDGSPKPMIDYSEAEIEFLADYIRGNIEDQKALQEQPELVAEYDEMEPQENYEQPALLDYDIEF